MKRLIICEKQLAANRIASVLSKGNYRRGFVHKTQIYSFKDPSYENTVVGLRGHITTLDYPEPYNEWMKVDPQELIRVTPVKTAIARNIINALGYVAKDINEVIIATDYDREGELIGAEALEFVLRVRPRIEVRRARFSALTRADLEQAFDNLVEVDHALVSSAECRQQVDLVWGATLTRFISLASNQLGRDFLSVGRVQTPTLAIIVDREREIGSFVPRPFWDVTAVLQKGLRFEARHVSSPFWDEDEAFETLKKTKGARSGKVQDVKKRTVKDRGPVPFNTTAFLAETSSLGISSPRAMRIAEALYTAGFISYPRTDNSAYPPTLSLRSILKKLAKSELGPLAEELLSTDLRPRNGRATKDHPPIHPVEAATKKDLKGELWDVYELVVRRFFASLAPDALVEETKVDIDVNTEMFNARGYLTLSEGWRKYYPYHQMKDVVLPELSRNDSVDVLEVKKIEGRTSPPLRFSHGSLIQLMEKLGLGTKSTRHEILQKLLERKYVHGRYLAPTHIGSAVTEALEKNAKTITEPKMTAVLEEDMSAIAEGRKTLEEVVEESRAMLESVMRDLKAGEKEIGEAIAEALRKHHYLGKCKLCEGDLMVKMSGNGRRFASCTERPKCTASYPLPQSGLLSPTDEVCDCGAPRIKRRSGKWTETLCINSNCPVSVKEKTIARCRACGGNLIIRYSKHGKRFLGCSNYPRCESTYSLPQRGYVHKTNDTCPICTYPLVKIVTKGRAWQVCINKNKHERTEEPIPS